MVWTVIPIVLAVLVVVMLFFWRGRSTTTLRPATPPGRLEDAIAGLLTSEQSDAFLIVDIRGSEDFLQFTAVPGSVQMDFPLITDRQKQVRARLEQAAESAGLKPANRDTGGEESLNYVIDGNTASITATVRRVLDGTFDKSADEELSFVANGFDL